MRSLSADFIDDSKTNPLSYFLNEYAHEPSQAVLPRFCANPFLTVSGSLVAIDKARIETRVEEVHNELGIDGEGVIVAIMDRGIDWKNNDFRNEDGTTRIKYILDFYDDRTNGIVYTETQINDALANGLELPTRDAQGRGTTTTGIATGNGRNSDGKYRGMAPKASIIAVKMTSPALPAHGDQPAEQQLGGQDLFLKGMDFVVDKAAELGMPVVMLPNIGSNGGPTDGTSRLSQKIDSIVGSGIKGISFINGPGDEGGGANRAEANIQPGETISLEIEKGQPGNLRIDLWYPTSGDGDVGLDFTIIAPGNATYGPFTSVINETEVKGNSVPGVYSYAHRGRDQDFFSSTNQKREVLIDFTGATGTYTIEITRPATATTLKEFKATLNFSNYKQNPPNAFKTFLVPGNAWDGATSFNNISPTNYVLQDQWTDVNGVQRTSPAADGAIGDIWAGSSIGPTFDGRFGVDVAAPGQFVITTYAPKSWWATSKFNMVQDDENGSYGKAGAVSAAAPQVTGIVALMLQANPKLDQIQIRDILRTTARADAFTGAIPNNTWGYGKVDAYEAVKAAIVSASADAEIYTTIVLSGDDPQLTFTSFLGVSYRIEYKDEINDPEWKVLVGGLAGANGQTTYLDETLGENDRRFYRICAEQS